MTTFTIAGSGQTTATAMCPDGKKVLGGGFAGGFANNLNDPIVTLLDSYAIHPTGTSYGWRVAVNNKATGSFAAFMQATCA